MARGGKRSGKVGVGYPNRTDLNQPQPVAVQTAPGQVYGAAAQQAAAQKAIPLTTPGVVAPTSPPASAPGPSTPAAPALPSPGSLGGFTRPTERPHEPVTTGSPSGPGPGPEVLGVSNNNLGSQLRGLYAAYPTEDLRALIAELDQGLS